MPGAEKPEIYFLGVIDVLTHYGVRKQAAYAAKTVKHGTGTDDLQFCAMDCHFTEKKLFRCVIASLYVYMRVCPSRLFENNRKRQLWCIKSLWNTIHTHVTQNKCCNHSLVHPTWFLKTNEKVDFMTFLFKTMGKMVGEIMDDASLSYWPCLFLS